MRDSGANGYLGSFESCATEATWERRLEEVGDPPDSRSVIVGDADLSHGAKQFPPLRVPGDGLAA